MKSFLFIMVFSLLNFAFAGNDILPMTMKKLKFLAPSLESTCLIEMIKSAHLRHFIHPKAKMITLAVGEARFAESENLDKLLNDVLKKAPELYGQIDSSVIAQHLEKLDIDGKLCDGSLVNPKRIFLSHLDSKIPNGKETINALVKLLTTIFAE